MTSSSAGSVSSTTVGEAGTGDAPPSRSRFGPLRIADSLVSGLCLTVCGALMVALLLDVAYGIVGRELLPHGAPPWTNEIAGWLLVWIVFLGAGLSVRDREEPCVRFVMNRLPVRVGGVVNVVTDAIALVAFVFLIWYGIQDFNLVKSGTGPASGQSLGWLALAVPVGGAFMVYFKLRQVLDHGLLGLGAVVVVGVVGWYVAEHHAVIGQSAFYWASLGGLLLLLLAGLPIAESMIVAAVVSLNVTSLYSSNVSYAQQLSDGLNDFTFVAIPLFLLTGALIAKSGAAVRLTTFARSLVGWLPGGLAVADIGASAVFADISGSPVADTVALGSSMIPELERDGFPRPFAAGLQAAAGTLGVMFPPSISILIYASVANVSVSKVFAALLLPGVLVMLSFMAVTMLISSRNGWGTRMPFRPRTITRSTVTALPALLTVVIVLGGIFSGKFTSSEAGAVASVYLIVIALLGYREKGKQFLVPAFSEAVRNTGRVGIVISGALAYGQALTLNNGPQDMVNALSSVSGNKYVLLTVILIGLVFVGTVLEPSTTPLVVVPVLLPVLATAGIDLVHFGVLLQIVAAIALILPPLGLCLFLVASIAKVTTEQAAKWVVPFIGALIVDVALVMFVSPFTTWLPGIVHA
jgi:C4-dicarboxylate transporter, DctM subunit